MKITECWYQTSEWGKFNFDSLQVYQHITTYHKNIVDSTMSNLPKFFDSLVEAMDKEISDILCCQKNKSTWYMGIPIELIGHVWFLHHEMNNLLQKNLTVFILKGIMVHIQLIERVEFIYASSLTENKTSLRYNVEWNEKYHWQELFFPYSLFFAFLWIS